MRPDLESWLPCRIPSLRAQRVLCGWQFLLEKGVGRQEVVPRFAPPIISPLVQDARPSRRTYDGMIDSVEGLRFHVARHHRACGRGRKTYLAVCQNLRVVRASQELAASQAARGQPLRLITREGRASGWFGVPAEGADRRPVLRDPRPVVRRREPGCR